MKTKKLLAILCIISATLSGCFLASFGPLPMDVNRKTDYMEYPGGGLIMDCRGSPLSKNSEKTDYFWDKNNLPHGTIYFVCKDGKAYLPGKEPKV